jgi:hypothetical protein
MPHYLRMLTYASQPQDDWGPARKEDQCGRYEALNPKRTEPISNNKQLDNRSRIINENINEAFDSQTNICSRL